MRYLKSYKIFESTKDDLMDILLELQDEGYRVMHNDDVMLAVTGEPSNVKAIWVRDASNPSYSKGLDWSELRDYALRIKDYLGDKYVNFSWRPIVSVPVNGDNPYRTVELNEDTEIDGKVWSFVIKYKE